MSECPEKIYLQACDECYDNQADITWCFVSMDHTNMANGDGHETRYDEDNDVYADYPNDTAYIREDIAITRLRAVEKEIKEWGNDISGLTAAKLIRAAFPELSEEEK